MSYVLPLVSHVCVCVLPVLRLLLFVTNNVFANVRTERRQSTTRLANVKVSERRSTRHSSMRPAGRSFTVHGGRIEKTTRGTCNFSFTLIGGPSSPWTNGSALWQIYLLVLDTARLAVSEELNLRIMYGFSLHSLCGRAQQLLVLEVEAVQPHATHQPLGQLGLAAVS